MIGEKGSGVAVWSHSEKNEVKDRETGGIFLSKFANKLFLISVRELFQVIEEAGIKGMDVARRNGFGKEMFFASSMIGIVVIKGYGTLIGVKDLPRMDEKLIGGIRRQKR